MLKHNYTTGSNCPVAFIAKNRQRIKQYNDTVYLNDGDEFQIELFNPTNEKVLAKIDMNAKSIGPGIILRPGERIFLERYVNESRKFKFETYRVNGENKEVMKAIELNGDVVIKFYKEQQLLNYAQNSSLTYTKDWRTTDWWNTTTATNPNLYTFTTCGSVGIGTTAPNSKLNISSVISNSSISSTNCYYNSCPVMDNVDQASGNIEFYDTNSDIETGRVEKGSHSNQKFKADYTNFESWFSWTNEWKLLPESRKPITSDDLIVYCSSCGRKKRKNENWCPSCGNKL